MQLRQSIHHDADEGQVQRHHPGLHLSLHISLVCVMTGQQVTDGVYGTAMDGRVTVKMHKRVIGDMRRRKGNRNKMKSVKRRFFSN